jgi:folate-binding protein YgfZ
MTESLLDQTSRGEHTSHQQPAGAMLHLRPTYGVLQLSDNDRHDFLHRLTTNEINQLKPGESTVTILTSPTARTLFAFTVIVREDDLLVLPGANQSETLARYLRGQIFFMDSVNVADQSEAWTRMRLLGAAAGDSLKQLGLDLDVVVDGAWIEHEGMVIIRQKQYDVPGYEILCPTADNAHWLTQLTDVGVTVTDDADYERQRVLAGRPAPGAELTDAFNPLESGMAWVCADDKGCYTGQEIIARQITYDKITRTLVGVRSQHALTRGADVLSDERTAGSITSVVQEPASGDFLALAVIKRPANEPDTQVTVDGQPAIVTALPFSTTDI